MRRWWAQLSGSERALERLVQLFPSGEWQVHKEGEGYYLTSERFERCTTSSEVYMLAEKCLPYMETVAAFLGHRAEVDLDAIVEHREDGRWKRHVFVKATATATMTAYAQATSVEGAAATPSDEPPESVRLLSLAMQEEEVRFVLRQLRRPTPGELYKVYEVIRDAIGTNPYKKGWVSKEDERRFKQTVQSRDAVGDDARHADRKEFPAPKDPMSLREARHFAKKLGRHWFGHLQGRE